MEITSALYVFSPQNFPLKNLLTFFPKKALSEKIPYIFRKWNVLIFRERNIQNPDKFRTKNILRTLSNMYDGRVYKIFSPISKK